MIVNICTEGEARTPDTWFWRPVLYQLSYSRKMLPPDTEGSSDKYLFD